ncbi:MAG: carbohydrate binding domain-containing protein [Oscillospiraceae bacterium]|nr:carbohydrate binding domain-containing protein [Oscillospiraceae bacterium]
MKKSLRVVASFATCLSLCASFFADKVVKDDVVHAQENYNCSFDSGIGDWSGRGSVEVKQSADNVYSGSASLSVSGRTDNWNGCQLPLDTATFSPGSTYSFYSAVYNAGRSEAEMMMSFQYDVDGETKYDHITSKTVSSGNWAILSSSAYTIPANAENPVLYFETAKGSASFFIDDVKIGSKGEFMDTIITGESMGDLNNDNMINISDFIIMKNHMIDSKLGVPRQADVTGDGNFDIHDLLLFFEYLNGNPVEFKEPPVVEPPADEKDDFEYNSAVSYKSAPDSYLRPCSQSGKVIKESYSGINGNKSLNVYLPYGYDESQKYDIFYLMHGGGENENTIFGSDVELDLILDNMIMNGDLEPMIVVTPTFNGGNCTAQNFYNELRKDVIPFVEGKYSTYAESTSEADIAASRKHRAYGGFSMGAVSTWAVMANCLDLVAYYMPLSGDHWSGNSADDKAKSIVNAIEKSGYEKDEYFIFAATGSEDIAYPNIAPQIEAMKKYSHFTYTADFSQGNFYFLVAPGLTHWWGYVRHYVYDALPYFFHE